MLTFAFFVDSREAFLRAASLVHAKWRQAAKRIVVANEPATKMPSSRAVRRISGSHGWRSLHGSLPEKYLRAIRLSCPRWSSRPPDVSSRTRGPSAWHSARATGRLRLATGALRILTTAWIRDTVRRAGEITRRPGGRCSEHTFQRRCPFDGSASPLRWLAGPTPALDGLPLTSRSAPAALRPASPCLATVRGR